MFYLFYKSYLNDLYLIKYLSVFIMLSDNDKGNSVGALLMDLSKAFNYLSHKLIIAKHNAHGLKNAFHRDQRKKINIFYSARQDNFSGCS